MENFTVLHAVSPWRLSRAETFDTNFWTILDQFLKNQLNQQPPLFEFFKYKKKKRSVFVRGGRSQVNPKCGVHRFKGYLEAEVRTLSANEFTGEGMTNGRARGSNARGSNARSLPLFLPPSWHTTMTDLTLLLLPLSSPL